MRHIERCDKPPVLEKNADRWLEEFKASGADRPDSSKYAHQEVREYLMNMSHSKCFYCENPLKGKPREVDHHVEVSVNKNKAFDWQNLYLSCHKCNHKQNEFRIASAETLDPCSDSDDEIKQNLTYDRELILSVGTSEKGEKTIKKYHLDREELDFLRMKQLQKLNEVIEDIDSQMIADKRQEMTEDEKNKLLSFTLSSQPFSYMCEVYIRNRRPMAFT